MSDFNYSNIETAYEKIKHLLVKTPLISNDFINQLLEAKIYFKLENLQKTGSFKHRGANYKISKLSKEQKLKKEQAEINKLKNILAAEEYNNKFSLFKKKVETYNQKKSKMIKTFEDSKNEELKKFFVNLNKLMNDYMLEKSINVILDKKNIVMANIKNDISDEILQLVNKNELSQ